VSQAGDTVVEEPPARWQQPGEALGVQVDPLGPDMLDHADARDRVEALAGEIAVVHHPDLDPIVDPRRGDPLARDSRLGLRKGDADDLDAMARGSVSSEAPPAAADVEHAFARCQRELFADHLELVLLGRLQRVGAAREDRAAVGHRAVEEEREELWRKVVVMADRARVASLRTTCASGPELRLRRRGGRDHPAGRERGEHQPQTGATPERWGLPALEQSDHLVDVVDLEIPRDEGATEAELAGGPKSLGYRPRGAQPEGRPAVAGRTHPAPIPELDRERPLGQRGRELSANRVRAREGHAPIVRRSAVATQPRPALVPAELATGSATTGPLRFGAWRA
jgi:hypothetical protein